MPQVTVSPKYQVVIPKKIRTIHRIKPGQQVDFISLGNNIHLVPIRPIQELRGSMKGIDTTIVREPDRQL